MQYPLHCKTNCKYKSADATRADRPGRVHAVVGRLLKDAIPLSLPKKALGRTARLSAGIAGTLHQTMLSNAPLRHLP
jgi:hypothetical protein